MQIMDWLNKFEYVMGKLLWKMESWGFPCVMGFVRTSLLGFEYFTIWQWPFPVLHVHLCVGNGYDDVITTKNTKEFLLTIKHADSNIVKNVGLGIDHIDMVYGFGMCMNLWSYKVPWWWQHISTRIGPIWQSWARKKSINYITQ